MRRSDRRLRFFAAVWVAGATRHLGAADSSALRVDLPRDSPLLLQSVDVHGSHDNLLAADASAQFVEMHLRNTSQREIVGVALDVAGRAGGARATVTLPALRAAPGGDVTVRFQLADGRTGTRNTPPEPKLQIALDAVLFADLTSYGPDRLQSKRELLLAALEGRRERAQLSSLLAKGRLPEVRQYLNFGLPPTPSPFQFSLLQTTLAAPTSGRVPLTTLAIGNAPLKLLAVDAQLSSGQLAYPSLVVFNQSRSAIRSVWVNVAVRDEHGEERLLASIPISQPILPLQTVRIGSAFAASLSRESGPPVVIRAAICYLRGIEWADGTVWIPSSEDMLNATTDAQLQIAMQDSSERQRLASLFRRAGIAGVQRDLKAN